MVTHADGPASARIDVEWIDSQGHELDVVNAVLAPLGRRSALEWGCQHSCSPSEIEACTAPNCEAMTFLAEDDRLLLHRLVRERTWAPFEAAACRYALTGPAADIATLNRLADAVAAAPRLATAMTSAVDGKVRLECRGSPVAFAAFCRRGETAAGLGDAARAALGELARRAVFGQVPEVAQALLDTFR